MNAPAFDVIVLGVGGMGSATLFELARRGQRVLGLEQFNLVHDQGSSHGQTRVIRTAYYEHPGYVPLVRRSFERWYELEQVSGRKLLTECGCLNFGPSESSVVRGVRQSAREHALDVEEMDATAIRERFPAFDLPGDFVGVLEQQAGYLYVEECVAAHILAAQQYGAEIHSREPVRHWRATGAGVEVRTDHTTYFARTLVIAAGPWAGELLRQWGVRLTVMRQSLLWFGVENPDLFRRDRFPIYLAEVPEGYYYGLPMIDAWGHKVARHYGAPELASPREVERAVTPVDELPVRDFLRKYLPAASGSRRHGQVCTYTLTPDRHFILDRHPEHANVVIAAGFSGHGFKFSTVVGEIIADLATAGRTLWPIDMFRITRFGPSPFDAAPGAGGGES